ncbi:MAG: hypothetical protein MUF83_11280 [Acidimicrobiales bacterium]|jgi:hypothetical protein|nr:hypothetical protein [Acidimicrobiales bacterium]
MSTVDLSDEVVRAFVVEFGEDAPQVAEKARRSEITRHRIERALEDGTDPAARPGELPAPLLEEPGSGAAARAAPSSNWSFIRWRVATPGRARVVWTTRHRRRRGSDGPPRNRVADLGRLEGSHWLVVPPAVPLPGMSVSKRSVSLDDAVAERVERAADEDGVSFSSWLSTAAEDKLLREGMRGVREWEAEAGALTAEELAAGEALLDRLLDRLLGERAAKTA